MNYKKRVSIESYIKQTQLVLLTMLMLFVFVCCSCMFFPIKVNGKSKYGFTYGSDYKVSWSRTEYMKVFTNKHKLIGTCSYVAGIGRQKHTNDYVLLTKETMSPRKKKVKFRLPPQPYYNGHESGYGFSEYVSVKTFLPSLDDYKPQNQPYHNKISFSIGADNSSGATVGASYTINHNDLDITSSCYTPDKMYYVKYDYKPSLVNPGASNNYVINESNQLGVAAFHTSKRNISFTIQYDARFGISRNSSCSPWCIYTNMVFARKMDHTFHFKLK